MSEAKMRLTVACNTRLMRCVSLAIAFCAAATACGGSAPKSTPTVDTSAATSLAETAVAGRSGSIPQTIELTSFFGEGAAIPGEYSCFGNDTSPPLSWTGAPTDTKSFVLFFDESSAGGIYSRWLLYNLPGGITSLPGSVPPNKEFDDGTKQGTNSAGLIGYVGPCPSDHDAHRLDFFVFAIDGTLELPSGVTKREVVAAMAGHILARGEFSVTFRH